jgi:CheY-like chemotaxis protein
VGGGVFLAETRASLVPAGCVHAGGPLAQASASNVVSNSAFRTPESLPRPLRVLAVDDAAAFRRAIHSLLRTARQLELVGEADTGELALTVARECDPDLILMDVRMPGMGGLAATSAIKAERPSTIVVLISTEHPSELPAEAATCGAHEIVWKSELRPGLLEAIWLRHRPSC